jgi:hypothetical protein
MCSPSAGGSAVLVVVGDGVTTAGAVRVVAAAVGRTLSRVFSSVSEGVCSVSGVEVS